MKSSIEQLRSLAPLAGLSPERNAYSRPISPWSDVISVTIAVARSALHKVAARTAVANASGARSSTIFAISGVSRSIRVVLS